MDVAINPVDGVRIAYRATGTGPAVVMVHGTALSQVIWRGFGYLRELGADHTVVTLDLRGHGRSEKPHQESAYGMDRFVADVLAVLDDLGLERVDYVGYSLGARVGFSLADTRPERVGRFVSVAGAPGNEPGAFDRVFFPGSIETLETGGMAGFLDAWQAISGPLDPPTVAAFAANDAVALAAYMRRSERDPGVPPDRLAALATPVLMLVGSADSERRDAVDQVGSALPAVRIEVIEGATHADILRRPETARAIRAFLAQP